MASTGAIRAGRAFVELFLEDNPLSRGLNQTSAKLKSWGASISSIGKKVAGVGLAATTPLLAATKIFSDMGSNMQDLSQRTGVSVEALSQLGYAAEQSGTEMATLEGGLAKMSKHLSGALSSKTGNSKALDQLNLSAKDLMKLSPDEAFLKIGDALSKVENPSQRAALAMQLFGKSGTQLLPMLADGAAGVQALMKEADELGLTMSAESAAAAERFGDKLSTLWKVVKMTVFQIGAAIEPILTPFIEGITRIAATIIRWVTGNRELVQTVFMIAAAVVAGGAVILGFGTILTTLGGIAGTIATVVTGAFGAIAAAVGFLLSPIGLLVAAVVGLGGYFLFATESGQGMLDDLSAGFNTVKDDATTAFGGIADALSAGDIGLAAKVLWSLMKLEWQRGVAWISGIWEGFTGFFVEAWHSVVNSISSVFVDVWAAIKSFLVDPWNFFVDAISITFHGIVLGIVAAVQTVAGVLFKIGGYFSDTIDKAGKSIDELAEKYKKEIADHRDKGIADRRKALGPTQRKELNGIEGDRISTQKILLETQTSEAQKRQAARDKAVADAEQSVRDAEAELKDLRSQASDAAAEAEKNKPEKKAKEKKTFDLPDLSKLEKTKKGGLEAIGTFSGALAGRIGPANRIPLDQLAEQKKATSLLEDIKENTEDEMEFT